MKKLTQTKLKQATRLALAIHGRDLMQGISPKDIGLSDEEYNIMVMEAHRISERIAGKHPMNIGSIDGVLNYFKSL